MGKWPAPHRNGDVDLDSKARDLVTALLGCLSMADAPALSAGQRAQYASGASRQAKLLRDLFHGRLVIVVAPEKAAHLEQIKRAFPADADVEVVLDRRKGERRRAAAGRLVERRHEDRRQQRVEEDLRRVGAAVVRAARPPLLVANGGPAWPGKAVASSEHRILLIDDDQAIVDLLGNYFELNKRYVVDKALSGEGGLSAFEAKRPDVVLLDISMPGMDGLEVLKRMRQMDPSIPVIMVTGASYRESSEALKHGAFAYIPKPFDLRYIDHLIGLVTEGKRSTGR